MNRSWRTIAIYLALTFTFSSVFYALIISAGKLAAGNLLYVVGLMWCPGLAAIATKRLVREPVAELGWGWPPRHVLWGYLLPIAYAWPVYLLIWQCNLGGFAEGDLIPRIAANFGWGTSLPNSAVIALFVLFTGTLGMIRSTAHALGEEIGWRGLLLPELAQVMSPMRAALLSGVIWAAWHYPILLFADYNFGTPWYCGLPCFTLMVIAVSVISAWSRLNSGSLWPVAILHGSHNLWIQQIFTPLTSDRGSTKYLIDEFGYGLVIGSWLVALVLWYGTRGPHRPAATVASTPAPNPVA